MYLFIYLLGKYYVPDTAEPKGHKIDNGTVFPLTLFLITSLEREKVI
jgi:hypothetical protein